MRLTTRGKVVAGAFGLLLLAGLVIGIDHINYMGDGHWCFQSSLQCYFGGK